MVGASKIIVLTGSKVSASRGFSLGKLEIRKPGGVLVTDLTIIIIIIRGNKISRMDFEIIFADIIVSFVYYSTNLAPLSFPYYEIRGMYSRKKNNDPNIYIYISLFSPPATRSMR